MWFLALPGGAVAHEFFYKDSENGEEKGPVSSATLKKLAQDGLFSAQTLVRANGGKWYPADKVLRLSEPAPVTPQAVEPPADSPLRPCPDCGKPISKRATGCPQCGCPQPLPLPEKYPGLRGLAVVCKALALLSIVASVFALLYVVTNPLPNQGALVAMLITTVPVYVLLLWTGGELIDLLVDIERNTRS